MAGPESGIAPASRGDPWGAFVAGPRVEVRGSGHGPLKGARFAVKDLFDVAGRVAGAGSPAWRSSHPPAARTAPAIRRLLAVGASLVGTTRLDELAYDLYGENPHEGAPVNPAAADRVPGGSSSGSAVAVAGRLVDFALGTDTGCSVRLPAAACGILGIRPTHGRVPTEGVFPVSSRLDTVGWFARDARILREVGWALLEPGPAAAPPRRLLVARDAFDLAAPAVRAALSAALEDVEKLLGRPTDVRVGGEAAPPLEEFWTIVGTVQARDFWRVHGTWLKASEVASPHLALSKFAPIAASGPEEEARATSAFEALGRHVREIVADGGLLALPTTTDLPPRRSEPREERRSFARPTLNVMSVAGAGGLPQVTIPAGRVSNVPVGLSLVGAPGTDERLLDLVASIPLRRT